MSNTINHAENNPKQEYGEIIERIPLPWSPFTIVGSPERGYFIAFGKYQLTTPRPTKAEAVEQLEKEKWQATVTVAGLVQEMMIEEESRRLAEEMKGESRPNETPKPDDIKEHNYNWRQEQATREQELQDLLKKEQK